MDQQNPGDNYGTGSTGSMGGGSGSTGSSSGTGGGGTLGSGTSYGSGAGTGGTDTGGGYNVSSGTDTGTCPTCGRSSGGGLEQFLGRLGITDEMVSNLKGQFQNVDIDEYLNTARTYLKDGSGKATSYAKENPGKVAAGVAALALGAGLIYAAVNRDKE
ncbi:MAG TPA: hypothetical protein VEO54_20905 [Thermoanaerobaculia bacterium]|nr:hypothetical protein [Thermoanaerobaculia bacterium]